MSVAAGTYFDGRRAVRHPVQVALDAGTLRLVGSGVALEFEARKIRVSQRVGRTPRWLYLPDGGTCVLEDGAFLEGLQRERAFARTLHRLESRPAYAAMAVALVVAMVWLLLDRGVPAAVEQVVQFIPPESEMALGEKTLATLDDYLMRPTTLERARRAALSEKFYAMVEAAEERTDYRLVFRASPRLGANAFALPSGIIVMTDELVRLARSDSEILGVLAHELGHIRHRHAMRSLLEGSATALVIAALTGDIASTTSLAAAAPAVLLQNKYSRDSEREADRYAIALMRRTDIDPRYYAALLKRMEDGAPGANMVPPFLSSHPATAEREALALDAAGSGAGELTYEPDSDTQAPKEPAGPLAGNPEHNTLLTLLQARNFPELERRLARAQSRFESDPAADGQVLWTFEAFSGAPERFEPLLREWVEREPRSYAAVTARGGFYVVRALKVRGSETSRNTAADRMTEMHRYFSLAIADLERSLELTPKPFVSHRFLVTIARTRGMQAEQRKHFDAAIALAPQSLYTRLQYMYGIEPRWGGSLEKMEAFLGESRAALKDSNALAQLAARIPAYRSLQDQWAKDFSSALAHQDEAVRIYPSADALCDRAYVLGELERHQDALRDLRAGLAKHRRESSCLRQAPWLARFADAEEAIRLTTIVLEHDPASTRALNQRAYRLYQIGKDELAFKDYLAAAALGDWWTQREVGMRYASGHGVKKDLAQAVVWLRKAAAQGAEGAKEHLEKALSEQARARL